MRGVFRSNYSAGFTLPELLVAVAIFGLVSFAALIYARPIPQTVGRHNAQRQLDVALLIAGLSRYRAVNGAFPSVITSTFTTIGSSSGSIDLCKVLVPTYIPDMPYDPTVGEVTEDGACNVKDQQYTTGYSVRKTSDDKSITVAATTSEGGSIISLTKKY